MIFIYIFFLVYMGKLCGKYVNLWLSASEMNILKAAADSNLPT